MPDHELNSSATEDDQLWLRLKARQLTSQAQRPDSVEYVDEDDWAVRILQGIGGWFAALFLVVFLGFMVSPIFEYPWFSGLLGLVMNYAAFHYYQHNKQAHSGTFLKQLFLVLSLAGQALVSYAVIKYLGWQNKALFFCLALYQFGLVWIMRDFVHRLMSAWFAVTLIFWGHSGLLVTGIGSAGLAIALVWLWLDKVGWQAQEYFYEPLAYAAALALVAVNIQALNWYWNISRDAAGWLMQYGHLISGALHLLAYGFLYRRLKQQNMVPDLQAERYLVVLSILALGLLGFIIPGVSGAVLLLLVGFAVRQSQLIALGVVALLGFVSWYYYHLDVTLFNKAVLLAALGLILLLMAWLGRHKQPRSEVQVVTTHADKPWVIILTLVCVLVIVNVGIIQKQKLIKSGDLLLLKLAPVDPRSLMQGDYMRLRFALSDDVNRLLAENKQSEKSRHIVVKTDQHGVANFTRMYQSQPLQPDEYMFSLKSNRRGLAVATDAYFFEEGSASLYEQAAYGGFRVNRQGDSVLVGLYDDEYQLISAAEDDSEN